MANDDRLYIETVLSLYLSLPETPSRASRYDRELANQLCEWKVCAAERAAESLTESGEVRRKYFWAVRLT